MAAAIDHRTLAVFMTNHLPASSSALRNIWIVLGILLIAANLRGPMTAVAPLLDDIQRHFNLSAAGAGMMTSLPLLILALVSPLCAPLAFRLGLERVLFIGLVAIVGGVALRSGGALLALFSGTALIGVGIAIGNVLLPALVKRDFPEKLALLTSGYALTMGVAAALMSAIAIPLADGAGLGWQLALCSAGVLAVAALLVWLPRLRDSRTAAADTPAPTAKKPLWRYPLAWQVTLFMGLNSFVYYTFISWLPGILQASGYPAAEAGRLHGLMQLASACPGIILMALLHRMNDQRLLVLLACLTEMAGILGLLFYPQQALVWSLVFGFGNGATFILALSFIGLRSSNAVQAASLSGLAQCVGYLLAAFGPSLMGWVYDRGGSWDGPLIICSTLVVAITVFGLLAGRALQIPDESPPPSCP